MLKRRLGPKNFTLFKLWHVQTAKYEFTKDFFTLFFNAAFTNKPLKGVFLSLVVSLRNRFLLHTRIDHVSLPLFTAFHFEQLSFQIYKVDYIK